VLTQAHPQAPEAAIDHEPVVGHELSQQGSGRDSYETETGAEQQREH
jgi:hypothetical protein